MNATDIVLLITLAIIVGRAIQKIIIYKRKGGCPGCSGNCSSCGQISCKSRKPGED